MPKYSADFIGTWCVEDYIIIISTGHKCYTLMWNTCKEYDDITSTTAALGGLKTATVYGVRLNIICIDSARTV